MVLYSHILNNFTQFKCLLWRYRSAVACHKGRGSGCRRPGHTACGISPLGGGCHGPHHRAVEQMTHKLQNNYTKEILALVRKISTTWGSGRFPSPVHEIESEVAQSLHDPMDCSLPGSSIHGIFQARVLEWGVIAFSVRADFPTWGSDKRTENLQRM